MLKFLEKIFSHEHITEEQSEKQFRRFQEYGQNSFPDEMKKPIFGNPFNTYIYRKIRKCPECRKIYEATRRRIFYGE